MAASVGLGVRGQKGGAVVIALMLEAGQPRVLVSAFMATAAEGDRLALEPYGVAAEEAGGAGGKAAASAAVAEGRKRQDQLAAQGLSKIIAQLGRRAVVAALLVNRAGWITDLLSYSLAWAEHVPVAEGLAVREALRFAFAQCGLEAAEMDEKSLPDLAAQVLDLSPGEIDARLKALGANVGRPWRKEQKLACLAAWVALFGAAK